MMNRRTLLAAICGLPFVARWLAKPAVARIRDPNALKVTHPPIGHLAKLPPSEGVLLSRSRCFTPVYSEDGVVVGTKVKVSVVREFDKHEDAVNWALKHS
jgi:hypothetical protein